MHRDLIYDVGMHTGEDTDFYLKKGFRVVAIEANPALVEQGRARFARELASGQLRIVHAAIAPRDGPISFFVNKANDEWGTISPAFVTRNQGFGAPSDAITVNGRRFESVLEEHGIPYYMKVDIEGADMLCFEGLRTSTDRPMHVSLESDKASWRALMHEFATLRELGYQRFKVVSQTGRRARRCPFPAREGQYVDYRFDVASSGTFGEEAPGEWMSYRQAIRRYRRIFLDYWLVGPDRPLRNFNWKRPLLWRLERFAPTPTWYDTHASL